MSTTETTNMATTFFTGDRVKLTAAYLAEKFAYDRWVLSGEVGYVEKQIAAGRPATGTVQKAFKNGKVAVAVDFCRNTSEDGKKTFHYQSSQLEKITEA